ncbi:MAG: CRISPR-associated protein [Paludibacter sp. 47-17]|nr:MAG: CRISPR-associated protein [Paludibacter sp. 47-17]
MIENTIKPNGLKLNKVNTSSKQFEIKTDEDIFGNAPQKAWFIAYLFHRVVIGKFVNHEFVYYKQEDKDVTLEKILKLRVFNKDAELLVWRNNQGKYKARLRKDGEGEEQGVVDARQVMFGTETKPTENDVNFSCLTEKRGTEIILPLKDLEISDSDINEGKGRLCIHTRSYIGYIDEMQATYEDVRFVEFVMYKEGEL